MKHTAAIFHQLGDAPHITSFGKHKATVSAPGTSAPVEFKHHGFQVASVRRYNLGLGF